MEKRKKDHIELAFQSQSHINELDSRFYYEPLLHPHPQEGLKSIKFLDKEMRAPIWISSMTGGTELAGRINRNLAMACHEFGLGMGLGSCRIILDDKKHFADFDQRDIIGEDRPLFANLGINQVEQAILSGETEKINELVKALRADGLIIHVNPLQEALQPEGDRLLRPAIETIKEFVNTVNYKVIVKEVGQGMGPDSVTALMKLPIAALDFGAFGGTNFAKVELMRSETLDRELFGPFANIGHTAGQMLDYVNRLKNDEDCRCRQIIVSGGIRSFLDGFYYISRSAFPAIYGMASSLLKHAKENYEDLRKYIQYQIRGLELAGSFLRTNENT